MLTGECLNGELVRRPIQIAVVSSRPCRRGSIEAGGNSTRKRAAVTHEALPDIGRREPHHRRRPRIKSGVTTLGDGVTALGTGVTTLGDGVTTLGGGVTSYFASANSGSFFGTATFFSVAYTGTPAAYFG